MSALSRPCLAQIDRMMGEVSAAREAVDSVATAVTDAQKLMGLFRRVVDEDRFTPEHGVNHRDPRDLV